jgi:hypothetical protein
MTKAEQLRVTAWLLKVAMVAGRAGPGRSDVSAFRHLTNGVLSLEAAI